MHQSSIIHCFETEDGFAFQMLTHALQWQKDPPIETVLKSDNNLDQFMPITLSPHQQQYLVMIRLKIFHYRYCLTAMRVGGEGVTIKIFLSVHLKNPSQQFPHNMYWTRRWGRRKPLTARGGKSFSSDFQPAIVASIDIFAQFHSSSVLNQC